jgi:hypothetical protein
MPLGVVRGEISRRADGGAPTSPGGHPATARGRSGDAGWDRRAGVGNWVTFPVDGPTEAFAGDLRHPLTLQGKRTYPAVSLGLPPLGPAPTMKAVTGGTFHASPLGGGTMHWPRPASGIGREPALFTTRDSPQDIQTRTPVRRDRLPMTPPPLQRDSVLHQAVGIGDSDLLITAGHPAMATVAGVLQPPPGSESLTPMETRRRPGGPRHGHVRGRMRLLRGHREARPAAEALPPHRGQPREGRAEGVT